MRPTKISKLGFSPMKIKKQNKKMIFVGLYGYGKYGEYTEQPAFDDIIQGPWLMEQMKKQSEKIQNFNIQWPCLFSPVFLKKESPGSEAKLQ